MAEPINFLQERRVRRPGEEVVAEKPPEECKPEPKKARCSCCGKEQERMNVFLGASWRLCDGCIEVSNEILSAEGVSKGTLVSSKQYSPHSYRRIYRCSFCGKEQERVARLIAMLNDLFICNNCVFLCNAKDPSI